MKKYKDQLIFFGILLALVLLFYFTGEVLMPFVIGLALASAFNPLVKRFQKRITNRNLAVTAVLLSTVVVILGFSVLFGSQLLRDFERLGNAFTTFVEDNSEEIDEGAQKIKEYIGQWYSAEELEQDLSTQLNTDSLQLDSETLSQYLDNITSFFSSGEEEKKSSSSGLNWTLLFIYGLGYFVYIIYTYPYFEARFQRYFNGEAPLPPFLRGLIDDLRESLFTYFRERTKVVVICTLVFVAAFLIMGLPGAFILGLLAGVFCYIAHFHYVALIPLSLTTWALSVEQGYSFFLLFGIIIALFILISILEETVFFPFIMKGVASMNPAIMLIGISFWSYLLGTVGVFLGLPLTLVVLKYMDHLLTYRKEVLSEN